MGLTWSELTDEMIGMIGPDGEVRSDLDEWLHRELDELSDRYGGEALALGAVRSCTTLASHILVHEPVVGDLADAVEKAPWLETPKEKEAAERLVVAILAAAAGMPGTELACLLGLLEESSTRALTASLGVWMIFCALGSTVGIGVDFCGADLDDPDLGFDFDFDLAGVGSGGLVDLSDLDAGTEDIDVLLETAPAAAGLAAGLIAAVRSGEQTTALALARSVSAFGAEEEAAACLGLLGAIDESSAGLLRAAGEALEAIQEILADDDDDFDDGEAEMIGTALVALARQALARDPERSTSQVVADVERRSGLARAASR